ncbi:hypothetical protein [Saccharicrinis sp. 156]|uniref:hypothetical protein n=1 Tax=Saccharicrinis sp. 156 TaxID=3417574 RepID=UPI003D32BA4B
MKNSFKLLFLILAILAFSHPFLSSQKRNKGTSKREIRKRQEQANKRSQYNKFNPLQPMGHNASQARADFIWSYETANTVPQNAGNISIITPSRFSNRKGVEFGASIGGLAVVPAFYLKKRWTEGRWYFASRHQVYSYAPMLYWGNELGYTSIYPLNRNLPVSIALKNELILSKPFLKDLNCGSAEQAYIILTGAIAYDYGFEVEETDVELMQRKLLRQRSNVILGGGGFWSARIQGDFYIRRNLYATLAVRGLFSDSPVGKSVEQNSSVKLKLTPRFSLSAGYWMTFGNGTETPILPIIDLTYHFGNKQGREEGLFGR